MSLRTTKKFALSALFFIFSMIFFSVVFSSCKSTKKISENATATLSLDNNWEFLDKNKKIGYFFHSENGIKYHCVKIDLNQENLKILTFPNSQSKEEKIVALRAKKFSKLTNAKIAINTSPYTKNKDILGVHISNSQKFASEIERYSALYFEKDTNGFVAKIAEHQKSEYFSNAQYAFGGFFTILKDGEVQSFKHISYDARTAAGISEDEKTLYLLIAEKGWFGRGLSYPECADILKNLGAFNALEFDGGHSTSFYFKGVARAEEGFRKNSAYLGFDF